MKKIFGMVAAALLLVLVAEGTASAGPIRLRVEDVTAALGITITDNGPGDLNPVVGAVTYSGAISSNFTVNVTTGVSTPLIGGIGDYGQINLNSVNIATTGAGSLRLTLENTDFIGPTGMLEVSGVIGGTLTAPAGSSLSVQSWANGDNLVPAFGPDQPAGPIGAIGGVPAGSTAAWDAAVLLGPGAFGGLDSALFSNGSGSTFSLFTQVVINFAGPGSVSFDTNAQVLPTVPAVPEPASLLLLSTGIAGVGFMRRRKQKSRTTQA